MALVTIEFDAWKFDLVLVVHDHDDEMMMRGLLSTYSCVPLLLINIQNRSDMLIGVHYSMVGNWHYSRPNGNPVLSICGHGP